MYKTITVGVCMMALFFLAGCNTDDQSEDSADIVASGNNQIERTGYTVEQVAEHTTNEDCRSIINDNVYDLTSYISQHPGGPKRIEGLCGFDSSSIFNSEHGNKYRPEQALQKLQIGIISTGLSLP